MRIQLEHKCELLPDHHHHCGLVGYGAADQCIRLCGAFRRPGHPGGGPSGRSVQLHSVTHFKALYEKLKKNFNINTL